MTRKALATEAVALAGTAFLASLLFWLALYIAGIVIVLPAAICLLLAVAILWRKMRGLRSFAEYGIFSWLVATQLAILVAILLRLAPSLGHQLGGFV